MNDRRILESDGVVVVPQIVDAVGASWKRSEEHKEANHPKDMLIFKTEVSYSFTLQYECYFYKLPYTEIYCGPYVFA